jgi:protein SCO1/2
MKLSPPRLARRSLGAALALGLCAAMAACGSSSSSSSNSSNAGSSGSGSSGMIVDSSPTSLFDGAQMSTPFTKPDVTLTDADGKAFDLVSGTAGKLTLLYFGYTHCPDVCPTTMATLASAVRALPAAEAAKIDVVFVSTDPARDTPAVLHAWLGQFDPAFIGLTGSFATIQQAARTLGIAIEPPVKQPGGGYTVTHGAEVIAFDADAKAYLVYSAGTTVGQFTHDIPLILAGKDG